MEATSVAVYCIFTGIPVVTLCAVGCVFRKEIHQWLGRKLAWCNPRIGFDPSLRVAPSISVPGSFLVQCLLLRANSLKIGGACISHSYSFLCI